MTTIDRARLAREIECSCGEADHPAATRVIRLYVSEWREIIAALRKPDQEGEAVGALALVPHFDAQYRKAHETSDPDEWMRAALIGQQLRNAVVAPPQPAPEAGKLPSEEVTRVADGRRDRAICHLKLMSERGVEIDCLDFRNADGEWFSASLAIQYALALLSPAQSHDVPCARCAGTSWVCENHPDKAWTAEGCECGAGMPCPECDQRRQPQPHDVPAGGGDGDHPRIWLEPKADSYGCEGRLWCQDDVWEGGVEYVRASRSTSGRA